MTIPLRPRSRGRIAVVAAASLVALGAFAGAPAHAQSVETGNQAYWIGGAVLLNDETTAYLAVLYTCAAETEAVVTVKLVQDDARQGKASVTVPCTGKPRHVNVRVSAAGAPWQYGYSTAYADITGNVLDASVPHRIAMAEAIHDYPDEQGR
ncbi:hypothetical protein [Agromyces aerolatus]|uniref:hypothetical protein n=1 Tax=Agromyces sp. LY-1074 TaxID=3074080 RepID=UPI002863EB0B|nr:MULTISPECIES: hypothetical protein [unclassified Agromyces]MDR5698665.1 hypothetical protein [Agromyces sp. LY-1074]MDR5704959.1 hypothetical protein [Agromyces sp. LY-1358]